MSRIRFQLAGSFLLLLSTSRIAVGFSPVLNGRRQLWGTSSSPACSSASHENRLKYENQASSTQLRVLNSVESSEDFLLEVFQVHDDPAAADPRKVDKKNGKRPVANKLSRPERKALERARKAAAKSKKTTPGNRRNANHRKHDFGARQGQLRQGRRNGEGRYDLHSTAVPTLNHDSTPDDVLRAIKRAQNLHDAHDLQAIERFLLEQTNPSFAYGYRGSLLSRLAVAALHMGNHDLARKALQERREQHKDSMQPMESAAIIRGLLRVHNVTDALTVLEDELALPSEAIDWKSLDDETKTQLQDLIKHHALSLASVASRHFFESEPSMAVLACQRLAAIGPLVRQSQLSPAELNMPWARILRGASQCEAGCRNGSVQPCIDVQVDKMPCNLAYAVLQAMTTFPSDNNDRVYELLSNALVRRVVFVTGAVDMKGCPAPDRGEASFIGRSNVGKSSLINMMTNRKSLAYTSKRPGKTQQFNFFAVNDKPSLEQEIKYGDVVPGETKDADAVYLVDLPGFGYAKVPQAQRDAWREFLHEYVQARPTLKVVFHLVDARHGPTEEDEEIMRQVGGDLKGKKSKAQYVVVLTKADKNVKNEAGRTRGKVSKKVMKDVRRAMNQAGVGNAPVILTSAETKLGRDDLWRYMMRAAEA